MQVLLAKPGFHNNSYNLEKPNTAYGFCVLNELSLAGSPLNIFSFGSVSSCIVSVYCLILISSPVASIPNFSQTAGQNRSLHDTKSSSILTTAKNKVNAIITAS